MAHAAQADSMLDDILAFVESSTEAEIVSVERGLDRKSKYVDKQGEILWETLVFWGIFVFYGKSRDYLKRAVSLD